MVGAIRDAGGRQVELKVHPNEWQAASQIVVSRDAYVDGMFKQQRSARSFGSKPGLPPFRVWAFEHPARDGRTSDARVDRAVATWIRGVV